ncbi:NAD-dependent epimerase/dehydratase family protein [Candidatus Velamenicoccus archaeovorus]|nr:SDR family NAD(P)-dependent oxidoreductase [Candidatus Velamenicoccus archaeovorus]
MENLERRMSSLLKGRVVFVTGADGFIGSHLTQRLIEDGAKVHVFLKKGANHTRLKDVVSRLAVWEGDIRNFRKVVSCLKKIKPAFIYHLAALRNAARQPELIEEMMDVNVRGTVSLLTAALEALPRLKCFINTGTCEEYGNGPVPFRERQRETPVSPYSASKVAATYYGQMMFSSFGLPVMTLRPFLTYGPQQDKDMFIPALIAHCLERRDFPMTEGDQTREFNYVSDVVDAFICAARRFGICLGEVINVGNGREYTIFDVAQKVVKLVGNPISLLKGAIPKRAGEAIRFFSDNKKAHILLRWRPRVGLDEGLKKTIAWYRKNRGDHAGI